MTSNTTCADLPGLVSWLSLVLLGKFVAEVKFCVCSYNYGDRVWGR